MLAVTESSTNLIFYQPRNLKEALIFLFISIIILTAIFFYLYILGLNDHTLFFSMIWLGLVIGGLVGPALRVIFPNTRICYCYTAFNEIDFTPQDTLNTIRLEIPKIYVDRHGEEKFADLTKLKIWGFNSDIGVKYLR